VTTGAASKIKPQSAFDLAEGFHLGHALLALEQHGILSSLTHPTTAGSLARRHKVDRYLLQAALHLLAARTNLIARRGDKFRLTRQYDAYARFVIHQYIGAYGPNAVALDRILRKPALAGGLVDRRQHAKAFEESPTLSCMLIADLVAQLGFNDVLDLGCGSGALLADLAGRVPEFRGWGLDSNPAMCAAAKRRLSETAGASQVKIFRGDSGRPKLAISPMVRSQVRTLTAASLVNEFFGAGTGFAERWLSSLRAAFPGRALLIGDYYGQLGFSRPPRSRALAMHDFAQVISGQGIPPPNLASWKKIYRSARCSLIHVVEDCEASFFVHLLKL
jgi:SAM-dependent methyltransferase